MAEKKQRIIDILDDALLGYYEGDNLPLEDAIDIDDLGKIANDCFLVKVNKNDSFSFSYMGSNIIKSFGSKFFSKDITNIIYPDNKEVYSFFRSAVVDREPKSVDDIFTNEDNLVIKYREKIFPVVSESNSTDITYLFGGMRWATED
jgi:hypothetical protein